MRGVLQSGYALHTLGAMLVVVAAVTDWRLAVVLAAWFGAWALNAFIAETGRGRGVRFFVPIIFGVTLIGLWELAVALFDVSPVILPPPSAIAVRFAESIPMAFRTTMIIGAIARIGTIWLAMAQGMTLRSIALLWMIPIASRMPAPVPKTKPSIVGASVCQAWNRRLRGLPRSSPRRSRIGASPAVVAQSSVPTWCGAGRTGRSCAQTGALISKQAAVATNARITRKAWGPGPLLATIPSAQKIPAPGQPSATGPPVAC